MTPQRSAFSLGLDEGISAKTQAEGESKPVADVAPEVAQRTRQVDAVRRRRRRAAAAQHLPDLAAVAAHLKGADVRVDRNQLV